MRELAILADDLTGALDAAAAFASRERPVRVGWEPVAGERIAIDSETRSVPRETARARVKKLLPLLADCPVPFKKIDSLLRGNTFLEIAECWRSNLFDAIHVAPAFPAQGRTVAAGTLRAPAGRTVSILDGLALEGIEAALVAAGTAPPPSGVAVCDATSDADLRYLVDHAGVGRRILWCGSSGLARALAGATTLVAATPTLAIVGSRHPVTRAQVEALSASLGSACVSLTDPNEIAAACAAVGSTLGSSRRGALVLDLPEVTDTEAEHAYRRTFERLVAVLDQPISVIVVGGDTLFRLAEICGVQSFHVVGERSPGIPVSQFEGGQWDGTIVISKSGAFSDAGLFQSFVHEELQSA